jgi:hypothetical protein
MMYIVFPTNVSCKERRGKSPRHSMRHAAESCVYGIKVQLTMLSPMRDTDIFLLNDKLPLTGLYQTSAVRKSLSIITGVFHSKDRTFH